MTGPVLVGFGESACGVEAAWSLLDAGLAVVILARAGRRSDARHLRRVRVISITAPEDDAARCRDDLRSVARAVRPAAVLPLDDLALWLADAAGPDLGAPVAGPAGELAAFALDRRVQLAGAELVGLPVPPTVLCRTRAEVRALRTPVILRPALAVDAHRGRLVRTRSLRCPGPSELERVAGRWDERVPLLAQPILRGRRESVCAVVTSVGFTGWSAQTAVGAAGTRPWPWRAIAPDEDLLDGGEALLGEVGWRGPFALEFMRDRDGRAWFLGLDGRCPDALAPARRRGLEYPALAVADALGRRPAREPVAPPRRLDREIAHAVRVLRGTVTTLAEAAADRSGLDRI